MTGPTGPAGNYFDKYGSRNPVARWLMSGFLRDFDELSGQTGVMDVHEVGCGEGELTLRLWRRGYQVRGCDISSNVIQEARLRAERESAPIPFEATSLYDLTPERDASSLIVCCEVLEHLPDPERGLEILRRLARPWLLVSVPSEPLWRALNMCRLHYLSALGNTPGHVNHWSPTAFQRFLASRVDVVQVRYPLPWTMALCRGRD